MGRGQRGRLHNAIDDGSERRVLGSLHVGEEAGRDKRQVVEELSVLLTYEHRPKRHTRSQKKHTGFREENLDAAGKGSRSSCGGGGLAYHNGYNSNVSLSLPRARCRAERERKAPRVIARETGSETYAESREQLLLTRL